MMNAAEAIASLLVATGIPDLPFWMLCVRHDLLLLENFLMTRSELNTI
jgi:hypothetical protein